MFKVLIMRKFIYQSIKGKTSVIEVECIILFPVDDISVSWLPSGEFKARIMAPTFLLDKEKDGTLTQPVYCSHAFYDTARLAFEAAAKGLRGSMMRHCGEDSLCKTPSEEEIQAAIDSITTILL